MLLRVRRSVYCVEPVVISASSVLSALFVALLVKHRNIDVMGDARIYPIKQSSFA